MPLIETPPQPRRSRPPASAPGVDSSRGAVSAGRVLRQSAGAALALFAILPAFRLLVGRETGLAGAAIQSTLEIYYDLVWAGLALVLAPALVGGLFLGEARLERWLAGARRLLLALDLRVVAAIAAVVALSLTIVFSLLVLDGKPSLIDAMSQLLHARYWAAGLWAGPATDLNAFWHIQNSVITEQGWVSQYPPGHVLLLALGFRAGVVWLVGPLLLAVTVFFTTLTAARLLPERPGTVRLAALFLGTSAFLICLSGAFMNHVTSAAMYALAAYCAVRARDGRAGWAIGTGAAIAYAFAVRPLSALVVGSVVVVTAWPVLPALRDAAQRLRVAARLGLAAAGALPLLALLMAYNAHFFGGPTRFGYTVALGEAMRLGFHRDPWGNIYRPVEAFAWTGSDLLTLGVNLLETPISAVLLIGVWLFVAKTVPRGLGLFVGWAIGPVLANLIYWHHGLYMGPRMLLESAPGWIVLVAFAMVELVRTSPRTSIGRFEPRPALAAALAFSTAFGLLVLAPQRAWSYGGGFIAIARVEPPPVDEASLVFVHDAWLGRLAMQLAAAGMPLDSVETAMRQNSTCRVAERIDDLTGDDAVRRRAALAQLDLEPRASDLPYTIEVAPGDHVRMVEGESLSPACEREVRADLGGILDIAPLVWQGDLPGVPGSGPLYVRDLGPEKNARLMRAMPERKPLLFYLPAPEAEPQLVPYDEGMRRLWLEQDTSVPLRGRVLDSLGRPLRPGAP